MEWQNMDDITEEELKEFQEYSNDPRYYTREDYLNDYKNSIYYTKDNNTSSVLDTTKYGRYKRNKKSGFYSIKKGI